MYYAYAICHVNWNIEITSEVVFFIHTFLWLSVELNYSISIGSTYAIQTHTLQKCYPASSTH